MTVRLRSSAAATPKIDAVPEVGRRLDVRSRRLETTLVSGYVALSVLITLLSLLGGRVIQWHAEIERALRTDLVQRTEQLLSLAGSISEEGFSYVVSGDVHEEQQTLTKLAELDMRALKMRSQASLSDGESRGLDGVIDAAEQLRAEAAQMFAAYRATGRVPNERYVASMLRWTTLPRTSKLCAARWQRNSKSICGEPRERQTG
jgi:hypothetical protein